MLNKVTAYLSHKIRGSSGPNATKEQMQENCQEAKRIGNWLRATFSNLEIYVPAESEEFVYQAYIFNHLKEQQILDIDCRIMDTKDLLIVYAEDCVDDGSNGIRYEINHAKENDIPMVSVDGINGASLDTVEQAIRNVLELR